MAQIQQSRAHHVMGYVGRRERGLVPADHVEITKLLCGYHRDDIEIMLRALNAACGWLVETHWPQIAALAEALLADGRIVERKAIRRILGRRPRPRRDMISGIAHLLAEERIEAFLRMPAISAQMGPNRM
jgi:hypothetical protein